MPFVADHDDLAAFLAHASDLEMDFGDQWASRVENFKAARFGFFADGLGDAVSAEYDGATSWYIRQIVDKDLSLIHI